MTDISASMFDVGSSFDVTNLDATLQQITAVEATWRSPALPDEVKLDLASAAGPTPQSVAKFLQGIDADLQGEDDESSVEDDTPQLATFRARDPLDRSGFDQARVFAAGVAGEPAPTDPTADANKIFKQRAIERGYLDAPPNGTVDSTWSPELNSVRAEMAFDDYNRRMRGDRPGAVSTNAVIDMLDKWTSPSGLLAAATELDLVWDIGAIGNEFSSWGDKWRKVNDSSNPFDFGKNLVDAVTGPIDDIVMPIANWALLGSGIGAVTNTARIGLLAGKAGRGASMMRGLYSVSNVRAPANLAAIGERSWTATRLAKSGGTARTAVADAMSAWRGHEAVVRTKAGVQLGMRFGAVSQAQDLLPGYQGGHSLADVGGIGAAAEGLRQAGRNPLALPAEILVAPYNIFSPGTFLRAGGAGLNLLSSGGSSLLAAAGTTGGRAALGGVAGAGAGTLAGDDAGDTVQGLLLGAAGGAAAPQIGELLGSKVAVHGTRTIAGALAGGGVVALLDEDADWRDVAMGAAAGVSLVTAKSAWNHTVKKSDGTGKFVGHVSDFLKHTSFQPLADNQRVSSSFHRGLTRGGLQGEQLDTYLAAFNETGSVKKAFGRVLGTEDDEAASAAMAYIVTAASIDHTARIQAAGRSDEAFHTYRNKLINQLRTFDFDIEGATSIEDVARAAAMRFSDSSTQFNRKLQEYHELFAKEPAKAAEFAAQHNRIARDTARQLFSAENLPDLDLNGGLGGTALRPAAMQSEEGVGILEAYLPQVMPTIGNWPLFSAQSLELDGAVRAGLFDPATFRAATSPDGHAKRGIGKDEIFKPHRLKGVDEGIIDSTLRSEATDRVVRSNGVSVLANSTPSGRVTIARAGTPLKHEVITERDRLKDILAFMDAVDDVTANHNLDDIAKRAGKPLTDLQEQEVKAIMRSISPKAEKHGAPAVNRVIKYVNRAKGRGIDIDMGTLRGYADNLAEELAGDLDHWGRFGLDGLPRDEANRMLTGREALRARQKQIAKKVRYTAAEIDVDDLRSHYIETGETERLRALDDLLEGLGDEYKIAHGVEFMAAHDLNDVGGFADMTTRNVHAATIGNFFKGRPPAVRRMQEEARQKLALAEQLDVALDDPKVSNMMRDLRLILEKQQDKSQALADQIHHENLAGKLTTALKTNAVPLRLEDLQPKQSLVIEELVSFGWDEADAKAAWLAVRKFRNTEFQDLGLYAFEAKLRQRNELVQFLKLVSGTKHGEGIVDRTRLGAVAGGFTGAAAGAAMTPEGSSDDGLLGRVIAGAAVGAGAGAGLQAGVVAPLAKKAIPAAEMFRYGYIGNSLVNLRDTMRFTLSPYFDISRYTEGLMLAQTAAPLRRADGSRIALNLNMSPKGFRKRLAKQLAGEGVDQAEASRRAQAQFEGIRAQFRSAAKGDFDPEVLDSTGKWFSQIGIMGFNPTDWMTAAFGQLRTEGLDPETAYKAVREMYTYGTQGRSAAELSTNFVFFPFSFQKKALGHIGKWMNDDLARSLMIHDAFKTYEILDEKHNLDEFWRDHVPALDQLNRLNLLAYGLSPGRFGGINAAAFGAGYKASMGLFVPGGVSIKNAAEQAELQDVMRQLTPALNDINWMMADLKEQGHVLISPAHQTKRADVRSGYEEWNEYRRDLSAQLDSQGLTWSDLQRKPFLADKKLAYDLKRAEIGAKFPAWAESRAKSTYNRVALDMEKRDRLARAQADPASASALDMMLWQMETELGDLELKLSYQGVEVGGADGWQDAPPEVFDYVIAKAVEMKRQNERFGVIWDKYYRTQFGELEALV